MISDKFKNALELLKKRDSELARHLVGEIQNHKYFTEDGVEIPSLLAFKNLFTDDNLIADFLNNLNPNTGRQRIMMADRLQIGILRTLERSYLHRYNSFVTRVFQAASRRFGQSQLAGNINQILKTVQALHG